MLSRSTLKPGKPLKQGRPLARKTPMSRGSGFKTPGAGAGLLRVEQRLIKSAKTAKPRKPLKSWRGMKGRPPTAEEARFMDAIAGLGCIACRKDGVANPWISIHHIAGRTAPGAHFLTLPLCEKHHQHDDTDPAGRIGVHPYKARFEARYGTQRELLVECIAMLENDIRDDHEKIKEVA
jgi:hypothetical protein